MAVLPGCRRPAEPPAEPPKPKAWRHVTGGVAVELSLEPVDPARQGAPLQERQDVRVRVNVTDAATGKPYRAAYPAAWMEARRPDEKVNDKGCRDKLKRFLEGSLLTGDVLDLNIYHVLVLGQDGTVSVVDPRFSFGGSRLLTRIFLESRGADWALTAAQDKLFVSMPEVGRVAVIDPTSYRSVSEIQVGARPERVLLQPDEGYLWVASGEGVGAAESSVTALSVKDLKVVARIPVSAGRHSMAASDDSRFLFVTNRDAGTVSIIDVRAGKVLKEVAVGRAPREVTFSRMAQAAYVVSEGDGVVAVVDGKRQEVTARIQAAPGISRLAFEGKGRFGFLLNPEQDTVSIIDPSVNRIIQTGKVEKGPDDLTFSENLVYVRHRGSETVLMIPLADVGTPGKPISVVDFPGGRLPPGPSALAASMVRAPGSTAVLVANAADDAIYYYKEGMAAPMGHFKAYGGKPEAILVLDRTLREQAPGRYETTTRLKGPGVHDLAVLIDSPRVIHCFAIDIQKDPAQVPARTFIVERAPGGGVVTAGQPTRIGVRIAEGAGNTPIVDLQDVGLLVFAPGLGHWRQPAVHRGEGIYEAEFTLASAGAYYVRVQAPSTGLAFFSPQQVILQVEPPGGSTPEPGSKREAVTQ